MKGTRESHAFWRFTVCALAMLGAVGCTRSSSAAAADGTILGVAKESAGAATVTLTPRKFADGQLFVDIQVNTHTVSDLDKYDLTKIVSLELDGQKVAPASAPKLRGHHTSGQLTFRINALPKSFVIKIQGLDQPAERVMSWP